MRFIKKLLPLILTLPFIFLSASTGLGTGDKPTISENDDFAEINIDNSHVPVVVTPTFTKPIFPPLFGVSDVPPLNFGEEEWNVFASRLLKQNPISRSKVFDPSDKGTWFNPFRMILPSAEDTEKVKLDMTIGEVVSILGKPQIQVGSGSIIFAFYLNNGQVFLTEWDSNIASDRIYRLWRMELLDENPFKIYL